MPEKYGIKLKSSFTQHLLINLYPKPFGRIYFFGKRNNKKNFFHYNVLRLANSVFSKIMVFIDTDFFSEIFVTITMIILPDLLHQAHYVASHNKVIDKK